MSPEVPAREGQTDLSSPALDASGEAGYSTGAATSAPDPEPIPDSEAVELPPDGREAFGTELHAPDEAVSSATAAQEKEEPSFAEMLAEHESQETPQNRFSPGQRVSARIVAITADTIFVSTGSKVDGIVDREEMEVDGQLPYQIGDALDLYVVTANSQEVKLSRILRGAGSLLALEEAREAGLPIEGKVLGLVKGGYAVEIMKRQAFCPASQISLRPPENPEAPVGQIHPFLITRMEKSGRNIVVSRRALLERELAENREALLAEIQEGSVLEGTVNRLAPFGAFVELAPGVEGLAHVSELSWSRIAQADEVLSVGDRVRVKVLAINREDKGVRISLSIKQVTDDPWKDVTARLTEGDIVPGKVTRNAPFGAFVEVLPGVEGLVHLSELSYEKRVHKADEVVVPGDKVSVKIKEIDAEKRRISLSLRDAAGNPWDTVQENLAVDAEVVGTVEKRAPFGLFVVLFPGITGLLPASAIQNSPSRKVLERLTPGDSIAVRITQIDVQNRRISLVPAGENDSTEEKDWKRHTQKPAPTPALGTLGMVLQAALKKKK